MGAADVYAESVESCGSGSTTVSMTSASQRYQGVCSCVPRKHSASLPGSTSAMSISKLWVAVRPVISPQRHRACLPAGRLCASVAAR